MAKAINRLSPMMVKRLGVGLHPDGSGLYLQVTNGADGKLNRSWVFRFTRDGRERRMGLGKHRGDGASDDVTLAGHARRQVRVGNWSPMASTP